MKADRQRIKTLAILLGIGLAYYIETQTLGFTLKCPLFQLTGLRCPACGLTTACIALLQGRFAEALSANLGLTFSLPVLLPWLGIVIFRWIFRKPPKGPWLRWLAGGLVVYAVLWGIARNCIGI